MAKTLNPDFRALFQTGAALMTAHAAGVLCLAGRGTPPSSRGRGRAPGRGGRGGGARGRGGEAPAPVVGWGERIARGEEVIHSI